MWGSVPGSENRCLTPLSHTGICFYSIDCVFSWYGRTFSHFPMGLVIFYLMLDTEGLYC